jgi:predicted dienelactone hydrolase
MRPIETLLIVANFLTFLAFAVPRLRAIRWMGYIVLVTLALAVVQVLVEGPRWQMVPAYVLTGLFLIVWVLQRVGAADGIVKQILTNRVVAVCAIILCILSMGLSAALPIVLPVFQFPRPSGPYQIGTVTYHWVDTSRHELFSADPNTRRELMVQVWYPAQPKQGSQRAPYLQPGTNLAPSARLGHLPPFFFDHLKYVTTNAQPSAPMAGGKARFPVLIYSPGRAGYRQVNTYQVEELVSHGYVVAAMDQPYTVGDVVFPDGRHVELDQRVADSALDEHIAEDTFMLKVYDNLGQDAVFTLNQLAALNNADPNRILTGRLDLQHVGVFGSSLGGITAAEACRLDHRFRACLILDVAMLPDVVHSSLQQPTMWISRGPEMTMRSDEGWTPSATREHYTTMRAVFSSLPADGYLVLIQGMFHPDITDLPAIVSPPLGTVLGATGPMDWQRTHTIINAYSLAFFDKHLKGEPEALLDGPSKHYPEVIFEKRLP